DGIRYFHVTGVQTCALPIYRREAIENIGYLSDRNLHSYEEYDLGVRLREKGWTLFRLDRRFVYHTGHNVNAYKLLIRRWQTKYKIGRASCRERGSILEGDVL